LDHTPDTLPDIMDCRFSGDDLLDRTYRPDIPAYFSAHPDIVQAIGGPLDFTQAFARGTQFYFGEHGGLMFEWCAPRTYEVHIMLTKAGRGAWGVAATKEALRKLDASRVWARIVPANRPLAIHAQLCGFRKVELRVLSDKAYHLYEWSK